MLKHVMVTLDGSELAEQALEYAERILPEGGQITLLSVVDVPDIQVYTMYDMPLLVKEMDYDQFVNKVESGMKEYLDGLVKSLHQRGLHAETKILAGDPAQVIVDQAAKSKVDTIVMSTHGRSGLSRWLFGSVTQKVLNAMPCPVLVVPGVVHVSSREEAKEDVTDTPLNTASQTT